MTLRMSWNSQELSLHSADHCNLSVSLGPSTPDACKNSSLPTQEKGDSLCKRIHTTPLSQLLAKGPTRVGTGYDTSSVSADWRHHALSVKPSIDNNPRHCLFQITRQPLTVPCSTHQAGRQGLSARVSSSVKIPPRVLRRACLLLGCRSPLLV